MKRVITNPQDVLGQWLCERTKGEYTPNTAQYIGLEENGEIIAVVGYDNYNGASVSMHVAGEGKRWMNREFLWYAFHYPFVEVGVNVIIGLVSSTNQAALNLDKHLGFEEACVIKNASPDGDLHILTMTREQCKFLTIRRP